MADDRIPAWAEAMEHRIIAEVARHVAEQVAALRQDTSARFDDLHNDITVAMGANAHTNRRVENHGADLAELRETMFRLWARLREVERRLGFDGGSAP